MTMRQGFVERRNKNNDKLYAVDGPRVYARRRDDLKRIRRRAVRRSILAIFLVLVAVEIAGIIGSYTRTPVVREPFHWTAAGLARCVGIPCHVTEGALDDGLLRAYVELDTMEARHNWLRGENPSGIDYEAELRRAGWSNKIVHAVGSLLEVSEGPF